MEEYRLEDLEDERREKKMNKFMELWLPNQAMEEDPKRGEERVTEVGNKGKEPEE